MPRKFVFHTSRLVDADHFLDVVPADVNIVRSGSDSHVRVVDVLTAPLAPAPLARLAEPLIRHHPGAAS
ncbi:MAG: hypothetical protein C0506_16040 [Anaerolinea sp.]|nr:hypothetical protein [Anaerolinea sp.]